MSIPERKFERRQQRFAFVVAFSSSSNRDIHTAQGVNLVVVDFGENDLFLDAKIEIAAPIKRLARDAAKVADAWHRDVDQTVEEFVHTRTAQCDLATNRLSGANLERC